MSENDWKNDDFLAFGLGDNIRSGNNANDESNDAAGAPAKDVDAGDRRRKKRPAAGAHPATNPTDLPPWMDERLAWQQNPRNHRRPAPLVALHNEIVEFAQLMEPRPEEVVPPLLALLLFQLPASLLPLPLLVPQTVPCDGQSHC